MNYKAYIFDLDDTLYDEESYVLEAFSKVCKYLSRKYNIEYEIMYKYCIDSVQKEGRGYTFDNLCKEYSIKEEVKELVRIYRECEPQLVLYEDAKCLLEVIKNNKAKIGIITDGNARVQGTKVRVLGLYEIADAVILTDEYKDGDHSLSKPDERVYQICLESLNVKPNEAIYIGDNILKDFLGAKKLGMKTVRIIRDKGMYMKEDAPSKEYEADYSVHSLKELME